MSVVYIQYQLSWVSFILCFTNEPFMMNVIMLNGIMLNVIMLSVVMLNAMGAIIWG